MSIGKIISYAIAYENNFVKISYIRKVKSKWVVFSRKGKRLGEYDTKAQAAKRLRQIEFFKHKQASKNEKLTYSSIMRKLVKDENDTLRLEFQKTFKEAFDQAYIAGEEEPEEIALENAMKMLEKDAQQLEYIIEKTAAAVNLGSPPEAGMYLANLIKWMLQRISPDRRPRSIEAMRRKIYYLNEYSIAAKKTPPSSSMGQALTLTKHLLLSHSPQYIRAVLNETVKHL
jgi:hypothetical protein